MNNYLKSIIAVIAATAMTGCATTHNAPTYSGDLKAAVLEKVEVLKEAGATAGAYLRNALSRPLPTWTPTTSSAAPPEKPLAAVEASTKGAQANAIIPAEGNGGASLTVEPDLPHQPLKNR
jgi:hypothetical protein